jgi:hypothetical protein
VIMGSAFSTGSFHFFFLARCRISPTPTTLDWGRLEARHPSQGFRTRRPVTKLGYLLAAVASLRSCNMRWKLVLYLS